MLTIRVAQHLEKLKLSNDSVIGFYAGNSEYLAPVLFATLLLGIPINPIDPLYIKRKHLNKINYESQNGG